MINGGFSDSTVERELNSSGVYASVTKGTSMHPMLKTNRDVVILKRCDYEPSKYDVVLYKTLSGKYLLHRIVKVTPAEFIIRGDNTFILEHVAKDRILAVLTEYNRKGRKHSVTDLGYRVYSRIWNFIYPIRFIFHKLLGVARKIYHAIFKKK